MFLFLADDPMNAGSGGQNFLKRRASRTLGGGSDSTSSSASSSVIMTSSLGLSKPHQSSSAKLRKIQASNSNQQPGKSLLREVLKSFGQYSACQQWETIVAFSVILVVSTVVIRHFIMDCNSMSCDKDSCNTWAPSSILTEYLIPYLGQIIAVCHLGYRLRNVFRIGSSEIFGIVLVYVLAIFFLFGFFFTSILGYHYQVLTHSWHIVGLLIDIPKVATLAHFVLCASHSNQISRIVAKGMSVWAPLVLLESFGKVLLFGLCVVTNVEQLVMSGYYALGFNVLNFFVFITVYPAILSLYFELTHFKSNTNGNLTTNKPMVEKLRLYVESEDQSPVVHRVKIVGVAALAIFHLFWFWPFDLTLPQGNVLSSSFLTSLQLLLWCNVPKVLILVVLIYVTYKSVLADSMIDSAESLQSLITFINRQVIDNDYVDTDENGAETSSSRSENETVSSSTDEGIATGTDACRTNLSNQNSSSSKLKQNNKRPEDCSSSDSWSEISMYKYNNSGMRCLKDLPLELNSSSRSNSNNQDNPKTSQRRHTRSNTITEAPSTPRTLDLCREILKSDPEGLTDEEVMLLIDSKDIRSHALEKILDDHLRGVEVRRKYLLKQEHMRHMTSQGGLDSLPYLEYDYKLVMGACAESVIGYMTIPCGTVGPLLLDGKKYTVPMATTEGCLIASTNRGCSALNQAGGVISHLSQDAMTRAPILEFPGIAQAGEAKEWMETPENFANMKKWFESTSRFAKLLKIEVAMASKQLHVRFVASTGDAMGMNMISKATEHTLKEVSCIFPDMQVISLSGNMCTDKKPSAINWTRGRGKTVVCEARIPAYIIEKTLKTSTERLVHTHINKNYIGSALAGSIGGFNAHSANIVTAIFIATGQDVAQTVGSSNCLTVMEPDGFDKRDLYMSVTMPSIEVGTVGGGTVLAAQKSCLNMLGVQGSHADQPGQNAKTLARVIAATVLAGELSLMSALTEGHLVKSHLRHNRSSATVPALANSAGQPAMTDVVSADQQNSVARGLELKRT